MLNTAGLAFKLISGQNTEKTKEQAVCLLFAFPVFWLVLTSLRPGTGVYYVHRGTEFTVENFGDVDVVPQNWQGVNSGLMRGDVNVALRFLDEPAKAKYGWAYSTSVVQKDWSMRVGGTQNDCRVPKRNCTSPGLRSARVAISM